VREEKSVKSNCEWKLHRDTMEYSAPIILHARARSEVFKLGIIASNDSFCVIYLLFLWASSYGHSYIGIVAREERKMGIELVIYVYSSISMNVCVCASSLKSRDFAPDAHTKFIGFHIVRTSSIVGFSYFFYRFLSLTEHQQ
jgi:hypothetical protein